MVKERQVTLEFDAQQMAELRHLWHVGQNANPARDNAPARRPGVLWGRTLARGSLALVLLSAPALALGVRGWKSKTYEYVQTVPQIAGGTRLRALRDKRSSSNVSPLPSAQTPFRASLPEAAAVQSGTTGLSPSLSTNVTESNFGPAYRPAPQSTPQALPRAPDAESAKAAVTASASSDPPTPPNSEQPQLWREAANALRRGDNELAERALNRLQNSSDVSTREAAVLAHAQLLMAQSRRSEARLLLTALAESGTSSYARARSQQLLRKIESTNLHAPLGAGHQQGE